MTRPIIKIENLSKQYRLGSIGTGTLSNDLKRWWYRVRGKEDPFLKIGETNVRSQKGESEYVWALKDINLEVMPGDVLGIIGKNGAGKSTLLKILSRVTGPTTGRIDFNGRIGSLLEVGTGFHQELTGRENIFLNGAILGMTKAEIRSKLDEIIDFSGCERYIDTPVKRYSSGMMVRLGFAVAAHLEPEILVVDEVLAVGDAEFQKKAIGKMQDVSRNEGRTVLFVSHNMAAVQSLCNIGIVLDNGYLVFSGFTEDAVNRYISQTSGRRKTDIEGYIHIQGVRKKPYKNGVFNNIRLLDKNGVPSYSFKMMDCMIVEIGLENTNNYPYADYGIILTNQIEQRITSFASWMLLKNKAKNPKKIILEIPVLKYSPGNYSLSINCTYHSFGQWIDKVEKVCTFSIEPTKVFENGKSFDYQYGNILPEGEMKIL